MRCFLELRRVSVPFRHLLQLAFYVGNNQSFAVKIILPYECSVKRSSVIVHRSQINRVQSVFDKATQPQYNSGALSNDLLNMLRKRFLDLLLHKMKSIVRCWEMKTTQMIWHFLWRVSQSGLKQAKFLVT